MAAKAAFWRRLWGLVRYKSVWMAAADGRRNIRPLSSEARRPIRIDEGEQATVIRPLSSVLRHPSMTS